MTNRPPKMKLVSNSTEYRVVLARSVHGPFDSREDAVEWTIDYIGRHPGERKWTFEARYTETRQSEWLPS